MTQNNIKKFFFSVLFGLGIVLLVGGKGILNIKRIYQENKRISESIERLKLVNSEYEKEIHLLKSSTIYQEKVIRDLLGFAKEDEIVYEFE